MRHSIVLATLAAAFFSTTAFAVDLPHRAAPPVFSWSSAYFGVNAGYAISDDQTITTLGNNGPLIPNPGNGRGARRHRHGR